MAALLELRQLIKGFYSKYDIYVKAVLKFLLSFCSFLLLNMKLGFMTPLKNPLVSLALAVVCTFLSLNVTVFVRNTFDRACVCAVD